MDIKDMIKSELEKIENEFETYASGRGNDHLAINLEYASIPRETDVNTYGFNIAIRSLFYIKIMDWENDEEKSFQVRTSIFDMNKEKIFDELLNCLYGGSVRILDEYVKPLSSLEDITTLKEVSREYNIPSSTLKTRMELTSFNMIEGEDFKKLGERMPTLLSPGGVKKITRNK